MRLVKKKAGLFFGSFNPVHIGHMAIANYFLKFTDLDEVWFVVSPHNPHKRKSSLIDARSRIDMLHIAVKDAHGYRVSDAELYLPQPSYTTITLAFLEEKFQHITFVLIMGSDNLKTIRKWYNYKTITENHQLYVYPRLEDKNVDLNDYPDMDIKLVEAPVIEISSSFIRKAIKEKIDVQFFLPFGVYKYIDEEYLYE